MSPEKLYKAVLIRTKRFANPKKLINFSTGHFFLNESYLEKVDKFMEEPNAI